MGCPFKDFVPVTPRVTNFAYVANINDDTVILYQNVQQSYTAICPEIQVGNNTVVIPAGTYSSYLSQESANNLALGAAQLQAEAQIVCLLRITSILIEATSAQDDDFRIMKNGSVTLSDTQLNVGWYIGLTQNWFPPSTGFKNNPWPTSGFRKVLIAGSGVDYGDTINVDLFDGWGNGYRSGTWRATINWSDGSTTIKSGGAIVFGVSVSPASGVGYNNYPPYFVSYYANGSFTLTK